MDLWLLTAVCLCTTKHCVVKVEVVIDVASSDHRRFKYTETKSLSQVAELPMLWLLGAVELIPQGQWNVLR